MNIIVAHANNYCIGGNNTLLWNIPEDLKRFKELTTNKIVVMGYNTWESLPKSVRPLPNRTNIVLSDKFIELEGAIVVTSIPDLFNYLLESGYDTDDVFIIGGASIYRQFVGKVDTMYITKVDIDIDGDAYFPEGYESEYNLVEEFRSENEKYKYSFCVYKSNNLLS
ncbi:MAG: dihydrofolate reductase [Paraclostridium sp.]